MVAAHESAQAAVAKPVTGDAEGDVVELDGGMEAGRLRVAGVGAEDAVSDDDAEAHMAVATS